MCPTLLPGLPDVIVFVRSLQEGFHKYIAVLNLTTSTVTVHDEWPQVADGSGCPAPLGPSSVMYLGCGNASLECDAAGAVANDVAEDADEARRWGRSLRVSPAAPAPGLRKSGWAQLQVAIGGERQIPVPMFPIGLTNAPGYVNVFESSQCDRIWGAAPPVNNSIICQGADPEHLFFLKHFVNPASGVAARNDTSTLRHVMTPRPYALLRRAAAE